MCNSHRAGDLFLSRLYTIYKVWVHSIPTVCRLAHCMYLVTNSTSYSTLGLVVLASRHWAVEGEVVFEMRGKVAA